MGGATVLVLEDMGPEDSGHYLCSAALHDQTAATVCKISVAGGRGQKLA